MQGNRVLTAPWLPQSKTKCSQSGLAVSQVELAVAAQDRHVTSSIGASRLPAGARRTAQHVISAPMILGPYVGPRGARSFTTFSLNPSRSPARA